MLPAVTDLYIYAGDTFTMSVEVLNQTVDGNAGSPVDLTGAVGKAQIRPSAASSTVLAEMTVTIPSPTNGIVKLSIPASTTTGLTAGVWDFQLTFADSTIRTLIKGAVNVTPEVTR